MESSSPRVKHLLGRSLLCANKRHFIRLRKVNLSLLFPYRPLHRLRHFAEEVVGLGGRVTFPDYKVERVAFGLVLVIALLMFFQPLVNLHGPNGSQAGDVLNVRSGLSQLQSNLRVIATNKYSPNSGGSPVSSASAPTAAKIAALPFSLRKSSVVSWCLFIALGFCLLHCWINFSFKRRLRYLASLEVVRAPLQFCTSC